MFEWFFGKRTEPLKAGDKVFVDNCREVLKATVIQKDSHGDWIIEIDCQKNNFWKVSKSRLTKREVQADD